MLQAGFSQLSPLLRLLLVLAGLAYIAASLALLGWLFFAGRPLGFLVALVVTTLLPFPLCQRLGR